MVKLWATMVKYDYKTMEDVPERYLAAVKKELGIVDEVKEEVTEEATEVVAEPTSAQ